MKSIEIKDFDFTLRKFINDYDLPAEVKRLVLKEIYGDISAMANEECLKEAQEREGSTNA